MNQNKSNKSLTRILETILSDTDLSIIAYISGIIDDSLEKNEINDSRHIHHLLHEPLVTYQICSEHETEKMSQLIFGQLIANKYVVNINTKKQLLLEYIKENQNCKQSKTVIARYSEDGLWYKAQVTQCNLNKSNIAGENINCIVNVTYTEYGNNEVLTILDIKLPSYWLKRPQKKQQTHKEQIESKIENDTISTAEYAQVCFQVLGVIFIDYLGGAEANILINIGYIDNESISTHHANNSRLNCCNSDWKNRIAQFKKFCSNKKRIFQTLSRPFPLRSSLKIYKIANKNILDGLKHSILFSILLDHIYKSKSWSFDVKCHNVWPNISTHALKYGLKIKPVETLTLRGRNYTDILKNNRSIGFTDDHINSDNTFYYDHDMTFLSISKTISVNGKIYQKLSNIEDLDKLHHSALNEWMESIGTITPELEKLFVTKLMNIKEYYVANICLKQRYWDFWGSNSAKYKTSKYVLIFAWCYDNSIFVYRDSFQTYRDPSLTIM